LEENKLDGKSLDIAGEKLAQLRQLLPEAFTERKIDCARKTGWLDALLAVCGGVV